MIDAAGDSILRWLGVYREFRSDVYLSDLDVRFKPAVDSLYEYECDADTIIRRWPIHSTWGSWDSVHRKLYVGQGSQKKLYVYDYLADSCLKVIDVSAIYARMPDACVFSHNYHRAYVAHCAFDMVADELGIIDTERDTLVRVLPVKLEEGVYSHVAVDERDGKAYITSYPDTMWVVDCATDSVLRKFACGYGGRTDMCIRWVPWSNRIYVVSVWPDTSANSMLVAIDCNTDSIIVPGMCLADMCIQDIRLDPVRQRIFVTGVDSNSVFVLRDTGYAAVRETPDAEGRAGNVSPTIFRGVLLLDGPGTRSGLSDNPVMSRAVQLDVSGRKVLDLHPGANDVRALAPGVHFVRGEGRGAGDAGPIRKVVVTR